MANENVEVGDRYSFIPAANRDHSAGFGEILARPVTGTVVEVNEERRWFRVAYLRGGRIGYECFKF